MPAVAPTVVSSPPRSPAVLLTAAVGVAVLYYLTARLGLMLGELGDGISLIWPPTGIAVAMLFRFGLILWPAVALAAFAINRIGHDIPTACGVTVGNVAGVVLTAYWLRKIRFTARFERWHDTQTLLIVAAAGMVVGALNGALWLCGSGAVGWHRFASVTTQWWLGDLAGILIVAPAILSWPQTLRECFPPLQGRYGCSLATLFLLAICTLLYTGIVPQGPWTLAVVFVPFVVIVRTSVLDGLWPAMMQLLIVLGFVSYGLLNQHGPIRYLPPEVWMFSTWGFLTVLALGTLLTAGVVGERAAYERRLQTGEANYRALVEDNPALICRFYADGSLVFANETFRRAFGIDIGMSAGMNVFTLTGINAKSHFAEQLQAMRVEESAVTAEAEVRTTDLGNRWFRWTARAVKESSGLSTEYHAVGLDVTDQVRAEEDRRCIEVQAVQTQKLESVGLLADGIAHEFNNLLTAILGNTELAQQMLPPHSEAMPLLAQVNRSAQRGADLTKQLLNYSMRGGVPAGPLDLSELVRNVSDLISVAVPKRCKFHLELAAGLPLVNADDSRLRQLIMGLVSNAGEAVCDNGGQVFIRTRTVQFDPALDPFSLIHGDSTPGPRVLLQVEDQGSGMTGTIRSKVFEPFFTTKSAGRGLGLAAVLGIVRDHGGAIGLCSRSGRGTSVSVLLPLADSAGHAGDLPSAHPFCKLCTGIDDTTDTPPEFTLPLPPFVKVSGYERSGYSSQVRSRSQRPRVNDF